MERIEFEDSCSDSNRRGSYNNDSINQSMLPVDQEENAVELVGSLMRGNSQKSVGSLMRGNSQKSVGSLMRGNSQKSVGSLEEMRGSSQK